MFMGTALKRARLYLVGARRAAAIIAAASVVMASAESALPDVHEANAVGVVSAGLTCAHGATSCRQDSVPVPANGSHVDHCAHGHLVVAPLDPMCADAPAPRAEPSVLTREAPLNVARAPATRPPIVWRGRARRGTPSRRAA